MCDRCFKERGLLQYGNISTSGGAIKEGREVFGMKVVVDTTLRRNEMRLVSPRSEGIPEGDGNKT